MHIVLQPNDLMKKFIWSPSKLAVFVGDIDWNNGCGVRLYLDHFAGPVYSVANHSFTFGTFVHELMEFYHADAVQPSYETVLGWLPRYWIASIYKKDIQEKFGELILNKLEHDEPVGFKDMRRDTVVDDNYLTGVYNKVDMCGHLISGTAERWMFLGYGSREEENAYKNKSSMIFEQYYKRPYIKPASLESAMLISLNGVSVRGRIDRIDNTENGYRVVDYKTSKKIKTPNELRKDFQMICYHVAAKEIYHVSDEQVEVGLLFLAPESKINKVSRPQPMTLSMAKISGDIVAKAANTVAEADRRVKSGIFHYADDRATWQCPWCSYYGKCGR